MNIENGKYGDTYKIGENVKKIISNRGIKYDDFAELIGVASKQEVYYLLHKKQDKYWQDYEINFICDKLHIKRESVVRGLE